MFYVLMARKLRLQFPGATYHVINRGNYRRDIFESERTAGAFEQTLGEACLSFEWQLHAFVIMRNHFHLALTTPTPNLVEGMHWLQATFAIRFNRFRSENGHLFQGRYRALIIEDGHALARVVDYIHLNPVRAKIVPPSGVSTFQHSSLPRYLASSRPNWLMAESWLTHRGLDDSPEGWRRYLGSLATACETKAGGITGQHREFSSGWAIGTAGWRRALAQNHSDLALELDVQAAEIRDFKEARWSATLAKVLHEARRTAAEAVVAPKGVDWKVSIARRLRREAGAPYSWIARVLNMGSPGAVRVAVCRMGKAS